MPCAPKPANEKIDPCESPNSCAEPRHLQLNKQFQKRGPLYRKHGTSMFKSQTIQLGAMYMPPFCGSLKIIVWNRCLGVLTLYAFFSALSFGTLVELGTFECGMFMWNLGNLNIYVEPLWNLEGSWNLTSVEPWGT